jgi:hypothetical protein
LPVVGVVSVPPLYMVTDDTDPWFESVSYAVTEEVEV